MFRFLSSLFSSNGKLPDDIDTEMVDEAIDRVMAATDKRLINVKTYRMRLRPAVTRSLVYINDLVRDLPDAIELSRDTFGSDHRVRALFTSYNDMQDKLYHATGVFDYLEKCNKFNNDPPNIIFGVLTAQYQEKTRLGTVASGDNIQREVMQVSVDFHNHSVISLAASPDQARLNLERRIFDFMLQIIMEDIIAERGRREQLQQQKRLLERKLTVMKNGNWGLEGMLRPEHASAPDVASLATEIDNIEQELEALGASHEDLDRAINSICKILSDPDQVLAMRQLRMQLDRMNIKAERENEEGTHPVEFVEAYSSIGASRIMLPGWFAVADIPPKPGFSNSMHRV